MNTGNLKIDVKPRRSFRDNLKLYVLPIFSGVVFIFIIVLLVIPSVLNIFTLVDEINQRTGEYQREVASLDKLKTLNSNSANIISSLNGINNITTADQTEVVRFRNKITQVINANNLKVFSQQLSENEPLIQPNQPSEEISLKEVPFEFQIEGSFGDIVRFFNEIERLSDFVIIKEMNFTRSSKSSGDGSTIWVLDLMLVKYQFRSSTGLENIYLNIDPSVKINQKVLDYINTKK